MKHRTRPVAHGAPITSAVALALAEEGRSDERRLRIALALAVLFHLALFAVKVPVGLAEAPSVAPRPRVYVLQPVRFKPPPPKVEQPLPRRRERLVPVPDPTPDEPEPLRNFELEASPETDLDLGDIVFDPPAPPPPVSNEPLQVGGEVLAPVKLSGPPPVYTELARRARIQGTVVLDAVIDREGNVTDVKVVEPLPMGLSESAVEALYQWHFRPGTLRGEAVPVRYRLRVDFGIQ
jgi:protein TonB